MNIGNNSTFKANSVNSTTKYEGKISNSSDDSQLQKNKNQ